MKWFCEETKFDVQGVYYILYFQPGVQIAAVEQLNDLDPAEQEEGIAEQHQNVDADALANEDFPPEVLNEVQQNVVVNILNAIPPAGPNQVDPAQNQGQDANENNQDYISTVSTDDNF